MLPSKIKCYDFLFVLHILIAFCLLSLAMASKILAEIPDPSTNHIKSFALKNHIERNQLNPAKSENAKVRIGLKITEYTREKNQFNQSQETVSGIKRHTLRAGALKSNHFYLGSWHIVTKPMSWNRHNGSFTMQLTFYKQYGPKNEVEEKTGSLILKGTLKGTESPYILHGMSRKLFKNAQNHKMADITAGFYIPEKKESVAKGPLNGSGPKSKPRSFQ